MVFLFIGGALTLGILSVINKVSPSDLLKGFTGNEEQVTPDQKTQEDELYHPGIGREPTNKES